LHWGWLAGGVGGHWLGGEIFGEGNDGQKLMGLGGALIGGWVGTRGGLKFDARHQIKLEGLRIKIAKRDILPAKDTKEISLETYKRLRARTPSKAIQTAVNKNITLPMEDPALPGLIIKKPLHADHIVSMKKITQMDGFSRLTTENQLKVLNNPKNFVGLSETANTSKGARSFSEWFVYKKGGIKVSPAFRKK